jgi:hypothetical protein
LSRLQRIRGFLRLLQGSGGGSAVFGSRRDGSGGCLAVGIVVVIDGAGLGGFGDTVLYKVLAGFFFEIVDLKLLRLSFLGFGRALLKGVVRRLRR